MVRVFAWATTAAVALISLAACDVLTADAASSSSTKVSSALNCANSPNVVQNGGFESGTIQPWVEYLRGVPGQARSSLEVVEGGFRSAHALQMKVGNVAHIKQSIPTCEASIYTVSFAYKVLNATASCIIRNTLNSSTTDVYQTIVSPLLPGDWAISRLKFHTAQPKPFDLGIALVCAYEDSSATILIDDIQARATSSTGAPGCPRPAPIPNGGFDDGQLAPWQTESGGNEPQATIVSPGFNSPYALELSFPASSFTQAGVYVKFNGTCNGYTYNVSFALNWVNYTGPPSNQNSGCSLDVGINGCAPMNSNDAVYLASSTPGWTEHSYVCVADANNEGVVFVTVNCNGNNHTVIPAFAVRVDGFEFAIEPNPA